MTTKKNKTQINIEDMPAMLVFKVAAKIKNEINTVLNIQHKELSFEQWSVLYSVLNNNGCCQRQLSDITFKDKPNITRILDNLEKKKLIQRKIDKTDRRKFLVFITDLGSEKALNAAFYVKKITEAFDKKLTREDLSIFLNLLKKLISVILFFIYLILVSPVVAQEDYNNIKPPSISANNDKLMPSDTSDVIKDYTEEEVQEKVFEKFELPEQAGTSQNITKKEKADIEAEITLFDDKNAIKLSLKDCLAIAMENNFNIKIYSAKKEQNRWEYYKSISKFIPDVRYQFFLTDLNGNFVVNNVITDKVTETTLNSTFYLECPLFTGFSRYFNYKATKHSYKAADKMLNFTKDEVILQTTTQYYNLLRNKINIEILKTNLDQTLEQLRITTQRYKAGVGTKFDVLRTEAEVATSEQELIIAYNKLRLSQAQLANTIGLNVLTPIIPFDEKIKSKQLLPDDYKLEKIKDIAIETRPDLDAARLNVLALRAKRSATFANQYIPQFTLEGTVGNAGTFSTRTLPNRTIGIRVDWFLPEGLGFTGVTDVKKLTAEVAEAKYTKTNLARGIEEDLVSSYYTSIAAKDVMKTTGHRVMSATESRRLSVVRLKAGVGTFIDVLQSQASATTAKIRHLEAIIEYNIAQAQLLFDMGVISVNNVIEGYNEKEEK